MAARAASARTLRVDDELAFASACDLARRVRHGELSPLEIVDGYLERIERLNGQLGSFVALAPERARKEARAAEARIGTSEALPFDGVPIGIKDLQCTEGVTTTFGTASKADFTPDFDEEHVARLRRAGFILLGKTNVPEWGTVPVTEPRLHGPARNPWDPDRTPGGSSGGAAAGLAAGLMPVAHGTDGGGSIRIPASHCALVGLKPARGRVSLAPLFGDQMAGLTTPGPLARHVEDTAALLDVMRGYVPGDPYWAPEPLRPYAAEAGTDPGRLRLGLVTSTRVGEVSAESSAATEAAGRLLEHLGHVVEPVEPPVSAELREHFRTLWQSGVAALPVEPDELEPFNAHHLRRGRATGAHELLRAISSLQFATRTIVRASLAYDALVSPTMAQPPARINAFADLDPDAAFRAAGDYVGLPPVANITGQPSVSLPLGRTAAHPEPNLPLGVMVTGRPADEATLLRLAGQVQRAADWTGERPPVS